MILIKLCFRRKFIVFAGVGEMPHIAIFATEQNVCNRIDMPRFASLCAALFARKLGTCCNSHRANARNRQISMPVFNPSHSPLSSNAGESDYGICRATLQVTYVGVRIEIFTIS